MLAGLDCQPGDAVPCAFMIYGALLSRCASSLEFVERQMELGLDTVVEIPPRPPRVVPASTAWPRPSRQSIRGPAPLRGARTPTRACLDGQVRALGREKAC